MVQREDSPLNAFGARSPIVDSAIIPAAEASHHPSSSIRALDNSAHPPSAFVQKADAVLKEEFVGLRSQGAEALPVDILSISKALETTSEALRQLPEELVDTFIGVAKHPPEQFTQMASPFTKVEGLNNGNNYSPLPLLKVYSPISPGQTGHIVFTLINDDPKETAEYTLYATELVGMTGHRIPEAQVTVSPNTGEIPPGESVDGHIEFRVPPDTPQGKYDGLLQTEDISQLKVAVQVVVGP